MLRQRYIERTPTRNGLAESKRVEPLRRSAATFVSIPWLAAGTLLGVVGMLAIGVMERRAGVLVPTGPCAAIVFGAPSEAMFGVFMGSLFRRR